MRCEIVDRVQGRHQYAENDNSLDDESSHFFHGDNIHMRPPLNLVAYDMSEKIKRLSRIYEIIFLATDAETRINSSIS